ncbi:MAG TPA: hypothetical protein VN345_15975, partial [Blastocatellia bacterium]|nr:hypothetical protein [Blastocatellia bacterium]
NKQTVACLFDFFRKTGPELNGPRQLANVYRCVSQRDAYVSLGSKAEVEKPAALVRLTSDSRHSPSSEIKEAAN